MNKSLSLQVLVSALTLMNVSGAALLVNSAHAAPASQVETTPDVIYSNRPLSPALQAQMAAQYPSVKVVTASEMAAAPVTPVAAISSAPAAVAPPTTAINPPIDAAMIAPAAAPSPVAMTTAPVAATAPVNPSVAAQPALAPTIISPDLMATQNEVSALQKNIAQLSIRLSELQKINQIESANYYKNTIPLPVGSNRLKNNESSAAARDQRAQQNIAKLQDNANNFKALSGEIAAAAEKSSDLVAKIQSKAGAPETNDAERTQLSSLLGALNDSSLKLKTLQENTDKDSQQILASLSNKMGAVAPAAGQIQPIAAPPAQLSAQSPSPNPVAVAAVTSAPAVVAPAASIVPAPVATSPVAAAPLSPRPATIQPAAIQPAAIQPAVAAPAAPIPAIQASAAPLPPAQTSVQPVALTTVPTAAPSTAPASAPTSAPATINPAVQPLVKIHYTGDKVDYANAVTAALQKALQKFPNAQFDVRGVYPATTNAAQATIDSTKSLRNAQQVIATMTQNGIPQAKFSAPTSMSGNVTNPQVQIFIR